MDCPRVPYLIRNLLLNVLLQKVYETQMTKIVAYNGIIMKLTYSPFLLGTPGSPQIPLCELLF